MTAYRPYGEWGTCMERLIVSYWDLQNQIDPDSIRISLMLVYLLVLVLIIASTRRSGNGAKIGPREYMTRDTGMMLRGLAIVLLVFGHLSLHCIAGIQPLESGGRWAVTIFLFISAIALTKSYGGVKPGRGFIVKRLRRVALPLWFTLILFYTIDFLVHHNLRSPVRMLLWGSME